MRKKTTYNGASRQLFNVGNPKIYESLAVIIPAHLVRELKLTSDDIVSFRKYGKYLAISKEVKE